ncbi:MAG: hypothetical protein HY553_21735 [Elusimicrobia bacterium]|nr:hypothetical protein [Elusimicrobiota bacterium]
MPSRLGRRLVDLLPGACLLLLWGLGVSLIYTGNRRPPKAGTQKPATLGENLAPEPSRDPRSGWEHRPYRHAEDHGESLDRDIDLAPLAPLIRKECCALTVTGDLRPDPPRQPASRNVTAVYLSVWGYASAPSTAAFRLAQHVLSGPGWKWHPPSGSHGRDPGSDRDPVAWRHVSTTVDLPPETARLWIHLGREATPFPGTPPAACFRDIKVVVHRRR